MEYTTWEDFYSKNPAVKEALRQRFGEIEFDDNFILRNGEIAYSCVLEDIPAEVLIVRDVTYDTRDVIIYVPQIK